jgi:DNA-binding transcriptional ArsR family regulator
LASTCLHVNLQANTCILELRRDVFQAIADPTRRNIIQLLSDGPLNLNSLTANFEMSRQAVALHIKVLSECGLVETRAEGREKFCEARLEKLGEVSLWLAQYRQHFESRLDSLEAYLDKIQKQKKHGNRKR